MHQCRQEGANIQSIFYSLCVDTLNQKIPPTAILQVIDHDQFKLDQEGNEVLLDIFWAFGMDTKSDKERRNILISIIKPILEKENSLLTLTVCYTITKKIYPIN